MVKLLGGPWDGEEKEWDAAARVQRVTVRGACGPELHEYIQKPDNPTVYIYTGRINNRKKKLENA